MLSDRYLVWFVWAMIVSVAGAVALTDHTAEKSDTPSCTTTVERTHKGDARIKGE